MLRVVQQTAIELKRIDRNACNTANKLVVNERDTSRIATIREQSVHTRVNVDFVL